ncbi:hypothetical protein [Natronorubrum halophilum]|uniref:hypothetical protein n=1 Tax=Natronorubrum halophilum TaxID=1702106 RepID=UPI0010C1804D|nr:hypothetical protein [Natronorubrum halophilum]
MDSESIGFGALFVGQLVGTIVFVVGLFMGGLTIVTYVGIAIIMLAIVGLALSTTFETREQSVGKTGRREHTHFPLGRGSK